MDGVGIPAHRQGGVAPSAMGQAPGATQGEYEFNEMENAVFGRLAGVMRFLGIVLIVAGVIYLTMAALALVTGNGLGLIGQGTTAALNLALGAFLLGGAKHVKLIVTTEGNDIAHLMTAMDQLYKMFNLQRIVIIVLIALMLVGLAFLVLASGI